MNHHISTCAYIRIHKNDAIFVGAVDTNDTGTLLAMASTVPSISRMSTVHCPLSTVHCPLSTVHCPLSTVHCPLSTVHPPPYGTTHGTLRSLVLYYQVQVQYLSIQRMTYTTGHPFGHLHMHDERISGSKWHRSWIMDDEPKPTDHTQNDSVA
jgi:hypothetical protein